MDYTSGYTHCALRPPPTDFAFTATVAVITSLISFHIDLLLSVLLFTVCNKRPNWAALGLGPSVTPQGGISSQPWRAGSVGDTARRHGLLRLSVQREDAAIAYILRALRHLRGQQLLKRLSEAQGKVMEQVMRRLGLHFEGDDDDLRVNLVYRPFYGSASEAIGRVVRRVHKRARRIVNEVAWRSESLRGTTKLKEALMHKYVSEHLGFVGRRAVTPYLDQLSRRMPDFIHPLCWISGWITVVGVVGFFIIWVLLWGLQNSGVSLQAWAVNLVLETLWGCFVSSTLRVFLVHVVVLALIRPHLSHYAGGICDLADSFDRCRGRPTSTAACPQPAAPRVCSASGTRGFGWRQR